MATSGDEQRNGSLEQLVAQLVQHGVSEDHAKSYVRRAFYVGVDAGLGAGWLRGMLLGVLMALFWSVAVWVGWG